MTTCRDIVTGALQLIGAYGGNETPTAADMATGMLQVQSLYDGWVNSGMFGRLNDVYTPSNYTAKEQDRVNVAAGAVCTLPDTVLSSTGTLRKPRDLTLIEIFDTDTDGLATWLYDRNAWVKLNGLTLDSAAPLAGRGVRGLQACVGVNLTGDFNMPLTPSLTRLASQFRTMISMKLGSTQDPTPVSYF